MADETENKIMSIMNIITDDDKEQKSIKKHLKQSENPDKLYELYQFIGNKINEEPIKNVKFKSRNFNNIKLRINEKNNFIENPFEIEEGVLECRCGSSKVYSYQKQVRAGDEGTTTFAHCIDCNSKWST